MADTALVIAALGCLCAMPAASGQDEASKRSPPPTDESILRSKLMSGPLSKAREAIQECYGLEFKNGRMELTHPAWLDSGTLDSGPLADRVQSVGLKSPWSRSRREFSGSSKSWSASDCDPIRRGLVIAAELGRVTSGETLMVVGGDQYNRAFDNDELSARIEIVGQRATMVIKEKAVHGRTLEITRDLDTNDLKYSIGIDSTTSLVFSIFGDGRLAIDSHLVGQLHTEVPSFESLADLPPFTQILRRDVFPVLDSVGIVTSISCRSSVVRDGVVRCLRVESASESKLGEGFVKSLTSNSAEERERALKSAEAHIDAFAYESVEWLQDPEISKSAASIIKLFCSRHHERTDPIILARELRVTDDIEWLIELLDGATPNDSAVMDGYLREITKQEFGGDAKKWKEWFGAQSDPRAWWIGSWHSGEVLAPGK